jgi:hypothetical protein
MGDFLRIGGAGRCAAVLAACAATFALAPAALADVTVSVPELTIAPGESDAGIVSVNLGEVPDVADVHPEVRAASTGAAAAWVTFNPPSLADVAPPTQAPFQFLVAVPVGTLPGSYTFTLGGRADGADVGQADVVVKVTGDAPLTLTAPVVKPVWKGGFFAGTIDVRGKTGAPQQLKLVITGLKGKHVAEQDIQLKGTGAFHHTFKLPRWVLPGAFGISATASLSTGTSVTQQRSVTLAGPPEGIVRRATPSGSRAGPAQAKLPKTARQAWVRFRFASKPAAKKVVATWYFPNGTRAGDKVFDYSPILDATVSNPGGPLPPGRWRCVLHIGNQVVSAVSVTIG